MYFPIFPSFKKQSSTKNTRFKGNVCFTDSKKTATTQTYVPCWVTSVSICYEMFIMSWILVCGIIIIQVKSYVLEKGQSSFCCVLW